MLPNALIVAFTDGANFEPNGDGSRGELTVDIRINGWTDRRRAAALQCSQPIGSKDEVLFLPSFVQRGRTPKQFILINNTKPLPKELIYKLLPTVDGLPPRLTARSFASSLTQDLNFLKGACLRA